MMARGSNQTVIIKNYSFSTSWLNIFPGVCCKCKINHVIFFLFCTLQNLVTTLVVILLALSGRISVEKLSWKLIRVWIPVNVIFIGMLVSGMYRYRINFTLCIFFNTYGDIEPDMLDIF